MTDRSSSTIGRFDLRRRERLAFSAEVSFRSQWAGGQLERWQSDGTPLEECVLNQDMVALNLGEGQVFNGQWRGIGRRFEPMRTNDVTLLPAKIPYSMEGNRFDGLILALDRRYILGNKFGDFEAWQLLPAVSLHDELIRSVMLAIYADAQQGSVVGPLYRDSLLVTLMMRLLSTHGGAPDTTQHDNRRFSDAQQRIVMEYINDRLCTPPSLEALADLVQLDKFRFLRQFNRTWGMTPHRYVLTRRLELAKELLKETVFPIAEVALRCGFSDQSHLATSFKRRFSISPHQFRVEARSL